MPDLNRVQIMGNLTRDPEVRYTPKGTAVGELGVAVNSSYKANDGTIKEEVCYIDIEVWDRQAETCQEFLKRGSPVFIEGRLKLDQWEDKEGNKKSRLRVRAERVQFLSGRREEGVDGGSPREERPARHSGPPTSRGGDRPARGSMPNRPPAGAANDSEEGDIPF